MRIPVLLLVFFNIIFVLLTAYYLFGRSKRDLKNNEVNSEEIKSLKDQIKSIDTNFKDCLSQISKIKEFQDCPPCTSDKPQTIQQLVKKGESKEKIWLTIGIPTTVRQQVDYLTETLAALNEILPEDEFDPFYKKVKVIIMTHSEDDPQFTRLKGVYQTNPHFEFVYTPQVRPNNPANIKFHQQSLDVAQLLKYSANKSKYYLFMEDDFKICPNGLKSIYHLISKANAYHINWIAIRCSFGLNGIIYHNNEDIERFAKYLEDHYTRRPPDHLITEFSASETPESLKYVNKRVIVGYRYNLFLHIGKVSSIGNRDWGFPGCYHELLEPTIFEVEAFNKNQCPNDDIWPCNIPKEKRELLPWVQWNK